MDILRYPDPKLKEPAETVTDPKEVEASVDDMIRTMHENKGVGIAATQVGIDRKFCIINVEGEPGAELVLLNPEIVEGRGEATAVEGCLSLPGLEVKVTRYEWVKVRATTLDGEMIELEGDGLFARAVQHEIDHLGGKLIIDRASAVARIAMRSRLKEMEKKFKNNDQLPNKFQ